MIIQGKAKVMSDDEEARATKAKATKGKEILEA